MPATELPPPLQLLKDNAVVIGIVAVLASSVAAFAFSQAADAQQSAPPPAAPQVSAVPLEQPSAGQSRATPSPVPSVRPTAAANPARGETPVVGQTPTDAASGAPVVVAGSGQQAVTAKPWRPVAEAFASAWANPSGGKAAWLGRLKPHATPQLQSTLAYTDIRNVPTDALANISAGDEVSGTVSFKVYFQDGGLRFEGLAIIRPDGSWLVDKVASPEKQ